jgi:hypothetical protein
MTCFVGCMQYSQSEDHVVNIILSAVYTSGWVGIGFSKDGMMVGSSAMAGWLNRKGRARVKQYYLQGSKEWQVIPDNYLFGISVEISNSPGSPAHYIGFWKRIS